MWTDNPIDTNYKRVIPRDLFNEAKLLKCIGRLVLLILDDTGLNGMRYYHEGDPFEIERVSDGSLTITNITFTINETILFFKTTLNQKSNYPLYCEHDRCEYLVFNEEGNYADEFFELCEKISNNSI